jgi:uncharacterized protein
MTVSSRSGHRPTLIVSCRPRARHERDVERWLRRLVAAAATVPGYVDSELQPPDPLHPGQWVVLYHFTDPPSLASWLKSPDRERLMESGREYIEDPPHEQVTTLAPHPPPVTAVSSVPVAPERMHAFKQLHDLSVQRMGTMPGFIYAELFEPVPGLQDDTVILLSFDTREHLDGWLHSADRKAMVELQAKHLLGPRTLSVVGGFAGWFSSGQGNDVVPWKSAVAVLLAIVPVSQVFLATRLWMFPDLNAVIATFLGNVVSVAVLTWVLMPRISRRLKHWLRRSTKT